MIEAKNLEISLYGICSAVENIMVNMNDDDNFENWLESEINDAYREMPLWCTELFSSPWTIFSIKENQGWNLKTYHIIEIAAYS